MFKGITKITFETEKLRMLIVHQQHRSPCFAGASPQRRKPLDLTSATGACSGTCTCVCQCCLAFSKSQQAGVCTSLTETYDLQRCTPGRKEEHDFGVSNTEPWTPNNLSPSKRLAIEHQTTSNPDPHLCSGVGHPQSDVMLCSEGRST